MTITFGPASSSVLASFGEAFGNIPPILLRDADSITDPGPVIRPSSSEIPDPTDRSARLQLFGEIARGGMGAVLKGRDSDLGRDLAVKILLDSHRDKPEMIRRFIEEAQIAGQLQHPGIVPIYELGAFGDRRPYFAMKLVKGHTLAEILAARKSPGDGLPRLLSIFESICQTMAYAHARGVIHRDLKPSNVMVGSFGEVQVMDWGLAKVLPRGGAVDDATAGQSKDQGTVIATARTGSDSDISQAGSVMGTPSYMAPEQARGEGEQVDERADVFALGSIFCEILTGEPAFTGRSSGEIQRKAARGELVDAFTRLDQNPHRHDAELISLARSCLACERDDRPRNAGEVSDRARAYQAGVQERLRQAEIGRAQEAARAEEATKRVRVERDRLRLTIALAASVFSLIALGCGGWVYLAQQRASRRAATERVVSAVLDEATLLLGQAKAAPVGDLSKWAMAETAAERARSSLDLGESSPALGARVDRLVADINREQSDAARRLAELERDRKFLDRLNDIRLDPLREEGPQKIDTDYATAFREFGVDVDRLDPGDAGRSLAKRSDPQEIALFLDDWALLRREHFGTNPQRSWRRLVTVGRATDQDPWRDELRKHIDVGDDEAVRRMAADRGALAAQPARSLYLLARAHELCQKGKPGQSAREPTEILELAWRISPGDYQICSQLGRICESKTDRIRFRTAAVTAKPGDAWAHSLLGNAYVNCWYSGITWSWMTSPTGEADDGHLTHVALSLRGKHGKLFEFGPTLGFDFDPVGVEELTHALAEYKEAVKLKPSNPLFRIEYGDAMVLNGDIKGALAEYREAARLAGRDGQLHEHVAQVFFVKGELDLAIAEMQEHIRLISPQPDGLAHVFLGSLYQKQGKKRLAFSAYRDVLLQGGLGHEEFLRLALETTGTPEDVFRAYRDAVLTNPGNCRLQRSFFNICLERGMTLEVQSALEADVNLLREKARLQPNNPHLHHSLGAALLAHADRKEAAVELRTALKSMQKDPAECNEVAWTLATSPGANQRYGSIAVEFAMRACELTDWKNPVYLDTLSAANAESGDFTAAVKWQTKAIELLEDVKEKEDYRKRLKLYQERKPYHLPWP